MPSSCASVCRCQDGICSHAERGLAIEIRIARKAEFDARIDPCCRRRIVVAQFRDFEFAEAPMVLAVAASKTFITPEVGKQLAIAPAHRAKTFPIVKILLLAANEDKAVNGR